MTHSRANDDRFGFKPRNPGLPLNKENPHTQLTFRGQLTVEPEDAEDAFIVGYGAIGDISGLAESFEILDPNGMVFWPHVKEFCDLD